MVSYPKACIRLRFSDRFKLTPENIKANYWLIYAMYHSGAVELARNEVQRAKSVLTSEEYATLVKYLSQDESLSYSQLIAA